MKTPEQNFSMSALGRIRHRLKYHILTLVLVVSATLAASAADRGRTFPTPEDAVSALATAVSTEDRNALRDIFGPAVEDVENPDRVQAANEIHAFGAAISQSKRIVHKSDSQCTLEVGPDYWPFPVPIVKKDGQWFFDTEAGKEELLNRRIGRNELSTLGAVRACVEAQRDYASRDRDSDDVLEYAQKFMSSSGKKDGLYWSRDIDDEMSPLGPVIAEAQGEGYFGKSAASDAGPQPFHGYFFKILTQQGRHAPGGKYDYIINRNMIGGFALVAWPAEYGESGVMTFIVNQQGRVYQKDLGPRTARIAQRMRAYDPDGSWQISRD